MSISGVDPLDGDFTNRPYDNVDVTCSGVCGSARHICTVTLKPAGVPIDALAMAAHSDGGSTINTGNLTVSGAPFSTNDAFKNSATLTGSVQCKTASGGGTTTGGVTIAAPNKAMPPAGIFAMYKAIATTITIPGSGVIDRKVLTPGFNNFNGPSGPTNTDGVYYINAAGNDIAITNCRIQGTLVINCPGNTVAFGGAVFIQPARPDYPCLIVNGAVIIGCNGNPLSEATLTTNYNPAGAPYQGTADADQADSYPGEIQGLVHCTDVLSLLNSPTMRGCIICESTDSKKAIQSDNTPTIIYDPNLFANPPMGYTKSVRLKILPGSWRQTVLP